MLTDPIYLLVALVVLCCLGYALKWACDEFSMPMPVRWLCGLVMLIIIISFAASVAGHPFQLWR